MYLPAGFTQSVADHADVRHRGELDQYVAANAEDLFLQGQYVRGAFLYKEDLLSSFTSSCRVHVYDVRTEAAEYASDRAAFSFCVADMYVSCFECLEIMPCSIAQGRLHFVVQNFLRLLREEPAVDSEASRKVRNPPRSLFCNPLGELCLVFSCGAAAALLGRELQREYQTRIVMPCLNLALELPPAFNAVHGCLHIDVRPFPLVKDQPGRVVRHML